MSSYHPTEQVICGTCGTLAFSRLKSRSVCQSCWEKEESTYCHRCGRTIRQWSFPLQNLCSRCRERDLRKQKVACVVCGHTRPSVLHTQAMCRSCWKKQRQEQGMCTRCHQQRVIACKELACCSRCYQNACAARQFQHYAERFSTPYSYNQLLFNLLLSTIEQDTITIQQTQQVRIFGRFLQTTLLPEPLSWETIETVLSSFPVRTSMKKFVRTSLFTVGYLLASQGKMEKRETFLAKRTALRPLDKFRSHCPDLATVLEDYAAWLWQRKTAAKTVGHHLGVLVPFWFWCIQRQIRRPAEVNAQLVSDYLLTLTWQFRCTVCQATCACDSAARKTPRHCTACKHIGSLVKEQKVSARFIFQCRGLLSMFFSWARLNHLILANPVAEGYPHFEDHIQHYPLEVAKKISLFVTTAQSDPTEALLLYLILFEALSLQELCHAQLLTLHALREDISLPTLAQTYAILLPHPEATRGRQAPGRPRRQLDFPEKARPFLEPLLERFEQQRTKRVKNPKNHYVFVSKGTQCHCAPVSRSFLAHRITEITHDIVGFSCTPKLLRQTAGVLYADKAGGSILQMMGWKGQQAYQYLYAPRVLVDPSNEAAPQEDIIFPSPRKEYVGEESDIFGEKDD